MTDGPSIPPPPPSGGNSSLVNRVINILTKPASEWRVIEAEPSSTGKLITYAALLSVLPVIFSLLAILITPYGTYIFGAMGLLIKLLLLTYAMALVPPVALAYILDAITPQLGGQKNSLNAMKLAIYSGTAFWVGSVGLILSPWLWLLIGVGYAGYLLWIGTPILMKTAADKTPMFVGAAVVTWVVLWFIMNLIAQKVIFSGMMYGM